MANESGKQAVASRLSTMTSEELTLISCTCPENSFLKILIAAEIRNRKGKLIDELNDILIDR